MIRRERTSETVGIEMMDRQFWTDFICPICHGQEHKLLHTVCRHKMCESCVGELFKNSRDQIVVPCPFCRTVLKRKDVSEKSYEEKMLEEEVRIRDLLRKE